MTPRTVEIPRAGARKKARRALTTTVAGLTTAVYAGHDRFAALEQRIERIERRLELTGGALDATP